MPKRNDDLWYEMRPEDYAKADAARKERFWSGVLKNPGGRALCDLFQSLRDKDGGLRGTFLGEDLFWWDESCGTHTDGYRWLRNIAPGTSALRAPGDEVELHRGEDGRLWVTARSDETVARAMAHPSLGGGFNAESALAGVRADPPEPDHYRRSLLDGTHRKSKKNRG